MLAVGKYPVSISNLEVKPTNADDSECENRKSPDRKEAFFSERSEGNASFFSLEVSGA